MKKRGSTRKLCEETHRVSSWTPEETLEISVGLTGVIDGDEVSMLELLLAMDAYYLKHRKACLYGSCKLTNVYLPHLQRLVLGCMNVDA